MGLTNEEASGRGGTFIITPCDSPSKNDQNWQQGEWKIKALAPIVTQLCSHGGRLLYLVWKLL
jgi:hypothetical protein